MKNFTPAQIDEMHTLMTRLGEDDLEKRLAILDKAFRSWKRGNTTFSELDEQIMGYCHAKGSYSHTDPVVTIADALAEGRLERNMISDDLFNQIEIVVRLMKN